MMSRRLLAGVAGFAVLAASFATHAAEPRYRIFHIAATDPSRTIQIGGLNNRGQVVGFSSSQAGDLRAFRWQNGQFTDLHEVIAPSSTSTRANDIDNGGTIVGTSEHSGFKLQGTRVTPVSVVPGETSVDAEFINDSGQMIVFSSGGAESGDFFVDGDGAELLPGVPGSIGPMSPLGLNNQGAVVGHVLVLDENFSFHAVLWQNGAITELGVPDGFDGSTAESINGSNRVAGAAMLNFGRTAAVWQDGEWTLLPSLAPGEPQVSDAAAINEGGAIVGTTQLTGQNFAAIATLWLDGRVRALDDLVVAGDPLKPFVKLNSASWINDHGDIVALGTDSRQPQAPSDAYFLQRIDDEG